MQLRTFALICVIGSWFSLAYSLGEEHQVSDDTKCQYMLVDKSAPFPFTRRGLRKWRIETKYDCGYFAKLTAIPSGQWLFIAAYGSEKSQRINEKGQVNLAPLDRFKDGDLFFSRAHQRTASASATRIF